ncbi:MAG TPA: hypothetical protein VGM82_20610 [Gemmatimonadaceae bacterium]|jgi:hypothetical protein
MNSHRVAPNVELDIPERVHTTLVRWFPRRVADALATEATILIYALASWDRRPYVRPGTTPYTAHQKSGRLGILYTIAALGVIEILIVDLVVHQRHHVVANVLIVAGIFGAIWTVGFARAIQLRPILLDDTMLSLRVGVQWSIDVPRSNIASVELQPARVTSEKTTSADLRLVTQPNVQLTLHAAQSVRAAYGSQRSVMRIAFAVDDIKKFSAQINN